MGSNKTNPDMNQAMAFAFKMVNDLAAAMSGPLIYIGDRMGLFKVLAQDGQMTVSQLAKKTGLQERYLKEWTSAMVASEILDYDPKQDNFGMSPEKAMVLTNEDSPLFIQGFAQMIPDHYAKIPSIMRAMREGGGVPYSEYGNDTFEGTERFFRPGYLNFLVQQWIPATGFEDRFKAAAKVADVGCGRGWAIVTMAKAFPNSKFFGFDNYAPNIERAKALAEQEGVSKNTSFEVRAATDLPQTHDFTLISNLDSLHDMIDPEGCAKSIHGALREDGAWLVLEPNVSDRLEENISPIGRAFYSISMLQCMTASLAHGGKGYGACMGPGKLREIAKQAGFKSHERLPIDNPFNAITLSRP